MKPAGDCLWLPEFDKYCTVRSMKTSSSAHRPEVSQSKFSRIVMAGSIAALISFPTTPLLANDITFNVADGDTETYSDPTFPASPSVTNIIKNGLGTLILNMPQTAVFDGNTTVNAGRLVLDRAVYIPNNRTVGLGDIVVNAGAILELGAVNQIPDGTNVILNGGTFAVNGRTEYFANLNLSNGAQVTGNPTSGVIVMNGAPTSGINATGGGNAGTISQQMALASSWTDSTSAKPGEPPRTGPGTTNINVADSTWLTISATILNGAESDPTGSMNKTGTGRLILTGANTYTGTTTVSQGMLVVNNTSGSGTGSGTVTVSSGAIIGGSGSVGGNLELANGAFLAFDTNYTLTLGGNFTSDPSFGVTSLRSITGDTINWNSIPNGVYTLFEGDNLGEGYFNANNISNFGFANAELIGPDRFAYFRNGSLELVVIPEPSSFALLAVGAGLLALRRRAVKKAGRTS